MFQVCICKPCAINCILWTKSCSLGTWPCFRGSKPEGCVCLQCLEDSLKCEFVFLQLHTLCQEAIQYWLHACLTFQCNCRCYVEDVSILNYSSRLAPGPKLLAFGFQNSAEHEETLSYSALIPTKHEIGCTRWE